MSAWAWMLASYSQESSIQTAVSETFSGDRPCGLCKLISAVDSKQSESPIKPNHTTSKDLKLMLGLSRPIPLPSLPKGNLGVTLRENLRQKPVLEKEDPPPREFV